MAGSSRPRSGEGVIPSFPRPRAARSGSRELETPSGRANLWKTLRARSRPPHRCSEHNLTVKQLPTYGSPVVTGAPLPDAEPAQTGPEQDDLAVGFLLGLLVGEGHF